ncbi:MAG: alpha-E domain-containing protein [Candidatus Hinthialibacter antarcticus]|nr:alpha-E domain-containing protein [Candidatus Hinthialibacter antarcticus]
MLSRVANSIYWMSRYIERAENVARFIDVNLKLMLDIPNGGHNQWEPLVNVTGERDWYLKHYDEFSQANVIRFLTYDLDYPNSIFSCLASARENARSVREVISAEMWEQINTFYLSVKHSSGAELELDRLHDFYTKIRNGSSLFDGITDSTMSHGDGWHFARMARLTERADKTSRIVDMKYFILLPRTYDVGTPIDNIQWSALLSSASGFHMYKQQYGSIDPKHVADFLILDRLFPRSIHYCLIKAEESLHQISGTPVGTFSNEAEQYLGRLRSEIDFTSIKEIIAQGMHEYLDDFQKKLNIVGEKIFVTFFDLEHGPKNVYSNSDIH